MNRSRYENQNESQDQLSADPGSRGWSRRWRGGGPRGYLGPEGDLGEMPGGRRGHRHGGPHGGGRRGGKGGPGFGRGYGGRPQRARRGDARLAILSVLEDTPANGYGIIKAIEERTEGAWKPSPGSVYPTLELLVDEGLITLAKPEAKDADNTRGEFQLTKEGTTFATENAEKIDRVWQSHPRSGSGRNLRNEFDAIGAAIQNFRYASEGQREAAIKELARTRRTLHTILAEEEASGSESVES